MERKYIAVLAFAAAVILVGGSLIRPQPHKAAQPAATAAPPPAPVPSRRGQMRQISDFLADRVSESARHVVFVAATQTSGVVFDPKTVITSSATHAPIGVALTAPPEEAVPVRFAEADGIGKPGSWTLVVARTAAGEPISASGILGGSADAECGGQQIRKLLLNVPLEATFAGAGMFDLSGELIGIVGLCDNSWTAIAHPSVLPLLAGQSGSASLVWRDFGVQLREPTAEEAAALQLQSEGLFVGEVRIGSLAAAARIQPGDLLVRSGEDTLEGPEDLLRASTGITLLRMGRALDVRLDAPYSLEETRAVSVLSALKPDSRLAAAGLRAGDRLIRVGRVEYPAARAALRLIERTSPVWVTYERDSRRIGVLLP